MEEILQPGITNVIYMFLVNDKSELHKQRKVIFSGNNVNNSPPGREDGMGPIYLNTSHPFSGPSKSLFTFVLLIELLFKVTE